MDNLLSRVRQIKTDAERICTDAADIEDARVLAENIVETCRRILANGFATIPNVRPTSCLQAERTATVVPTSAGSSDLSRKAAARARLGGLSARELEIFTHLAQGSSAAEIAVKLSRSSKTINNHRTRILQKLGLKNATELVRLAVQSGVVSV